jgi:predicted metal-binding membrane protein
MQDSQKCEQIDSEKEIQAALHQRSLVLLGLVVLTAASWGLIFVQTGGVAESIVPLASERQWLLNAFVFLVAWTTMIIAIMFPSLAPATLTFSSFTCHRREAGAQPPSTSLFVAGYVLAWFGVGLVACTADLILGYAISGHPLTRTYGVAVGGAVLIAAGLYQLGPLKRLFLTRCRTPQSVFEAYWSDSRSGAAGLGLRLGGYDIGCSWAMVAVLFAVGVMNLGWMGLVALAMFLERVLPQGFEASKVIGVLFCGAGLILGLGPLLFSPIH